MMQNNQGTVTIIGESDHGQELCAASARISTTPGDALDIFAASLDNPKNPALIEKVLASGHHSFIEHHHFNLAFNNVSVLAEQFLIEFRLASFMVKSRRYVDFRQMGYYLPPRLTAAQQARYCAQMDKLFAAYGQLLELAIPMEDARFVLPYCFHSNFYCSCNARELVHIIGSLCQGRGRNFPELAALGEQLAAQLAARYPNLYQMMADAYEYDILPLPSQEQALSQLRQNRPRLQEAAAELLGTPNHPEEILRAGLRALGQDGQLDYPALLQNPRNRVLELLHYNFQLQHLSLAGLTHLARHRLHSLLIPALLQAPLAQSYLLPPSIAALPAARDIYEKALRETRETALQLLESGLPLTDLSYLALAGGQIDVLTGINARELLLFLRLRCCSRAQWEIQALAWQMLEQLRASYPALYQAYGPSCELLGYCPEGRLSCGRYPAK